MAEVYSKSVQWPKTRVVVTALVACEYVLTKDGDDDMLLALVRNALTLIGREEPVESEIFGPVACKSASRALEAMERYFGSYDPEGITYELVFNALDALESEEPYA